MISRYIKVTLVALLAAAASSAQTPDTSGNATLQGPYFVREVLMTGDLSGDVTAASSVIGVATFDGKGNYTFNGQGTTLATGPNPALSLTGTYSVGANGLFQMQSLADPTDEDYGGVAGIGPGAFVGSATEGYNVTLLIGIPAGSGLSNATLNGNYVMGAIDFPGANTAGVRQASFNVTANGAGSLGDVTVTGVGADLGGITTSQTVPGVTYSLSSQGSGTIAFGAPSASQLVSGAKTFYISADGNILLGGSPTGFDILVGIPALRGAASNATLSSEFYLGAIEDQLNVLTGVNGSTTNAIDAYYGSANATGAGVSYFHNRIQSLADQVYDYTYDSQYSVQPNGNITPSDVPYQYLIGAYGQAYIALGAADSASPFFEISKPLYSLTLGLAAQNYSGSGVYLKPLGVVSSATYAPVTNPIAPNELISLFGSGFASAAATAANLPLPTTLGGVQVKINGIAALLEYVSPTQITVLVPTSISPDNGVYYATIQVTSNGVPGNSVTVYTSDTAPGVFAIEGNGISAAVAQHGNGTIISSVNPAAVGEEIVIYADGLGAVSPAVAPDGSAAPSNPLSEVPTGSISVDFSGLYAQTIYFAGLTPTFAGLYQINVPIPSGASGTAYVDVATADGVTSETTITIAGGNSTGSAAKRKPRKTLQAKKAPGLRGGRQHGIAGSRHIKLAPGTTSSLNQSP